MDKPTLFSGSVITCRRNINNSRHIVVIVIVIVIVVIVIVIVIFIVVIVTIIVIIVVVIVTVGMPGAFSPTCGLGCQ